MTATGARPGKGLVAYDGELGGYGGLEPIGTGDGVIGLEAASANRHGAL